MQVLIEAASHEEASIIEALKEGVCVIDFLNYPFIRLLADMYHMNTEEPPLLDSPSEYMDYYSHPHILDDNRAYSGLGSPDFTTIYQKLVKSGYRGTAAVEGNMQHGLLKDTQICTAYLHKVCDGLYTPSHVSCYAV